MIVTQRTEDANESAVLLASMPHVRDISTALCAFLLVKNGYKNRAKMKKLLGGIL